MSQDFDVFISHSSLDFAKADALRAALEAKGVKCWIAPRDIPLGADHGHSIGQAIDSTPVVLVIFSSHSDTSPNVKRELILAIDVGAAIIPIRVEDVRPTHLRFYLTGTQWTDAYKGAFENHIERIVREVMGALKKSPRTVAPPLRDGHTPFDTLWQAFGMKVESDPEWLLPGLSWSKYRVSFTSAESARGANIGGAGTIYTAAKDHVEQVWVELGRDVKVTNQAVRGVIGPSAHTGFIGSIVEELRRLEDIISSDEAQEGRPVVTAAIGFAAAVAHGVTRRVAERLNPQDALDQPALTAFDRAWKAFEDKVRSDSGWLLPGLGSSAFSVSFTSQDEVSGVIASFGGEPRVTSKSFVQQAWDELEPGVRASNPALIEILGREAHTNLVGAIIEELRRIEATLGPDEPELEEPGSTEIEAAPSLQAAMSRKGLWRKSSIFDAIRAGASDVGESDRRNYTALHYVADTVPDEEPMGLLRQVLVHGPNLDARTNKGQTPLHLAAANNNIGVARLLLVRGADPGLLDKKGWSPLAIAKDYDDPDMIHLLQLFVTRSEERANQALNEDYFKSNLSAKIAKILNAIAAGATQIALRDNRGWTPLHWAAYANEPELVRLLLNKGADASAADDVGVTPLTFAQKYGSADIEAVLREQAAKPGRS